MSELHYPSRHLWLRNYDESRAAVWNALTGRRALLTLEALEELESFREGRRVEVGQELHNRLLEADLICQSQYEFDSIPCYEKLQKSLGRYLVDRLETTRRKLDNDHPSFLERLTKTEELVRSDIESHPDLTQEQKEVTLRDLTVLVDHVHTFLHLDLGLTFEQRPEPIDKDIPFCFPDRFLTRSVGRPLPREDYEQQPCLPETSHRRISLASEFVKTGSRCLMLGDDDLLSILWERYPEMPCDVFELDDQLIDFLKPELAEHLTLRTRDLTEGLPQEFKHQYELIFTDPMYERKGMDLFLKCCAEGLSDSPTARVLFTTRPDMIDDGHLLEERMAEVGLVVEKRLPDFSRYRLPNFYRRKLIRGFHEAGISPQLVQGLCEIPYLYADMFWLKKS